MKPLALHPGAAGSAPPPLAPPPPAAAGALAALPGAGAQEPAAPPPFKLHRRFDRIARLVGDSAMERLAAAHVMVLGQGGVGSWASEALVRSGVGRITLVDFDLVCATNANRQLHAMARTSGKVKVDVVAERLQAINPAARIIPIRAFYNAASSDELLASAPDYVIDAIDNITAKCHLIATCHQRGIPLVVSCGAAARLDPTKIRVSDLAVTEHDALARAVRKILRQKWGFPGPQEGPFGVDAVYSEEPASDPLALAYDHGEGFRCVCPQGNNDLHACEHRNRIDGSAGFVTGAFGFAAASVVVRALSAGRSA